MTNRIDEEVLKGVVNSSNVDSISSCKFFRHCLTDQYQENIEFVKSRGCNIDTLINALDKHIDVEDEQLEVYSEVKRMFSTSSNRKDTVVFTPEMKRIFEVGANKGKADKREFFFEDLINAAFDAYKKDPDMYICHYMVLCGYKHDPNSGIAATGKYKFVAELCDNLNERAKDKRIDPLIGRKKEVERIVEILAHYKKKNPLLIGKPGVGKTAVVEGLASMIVQKMVPKALEKSVVYSLNVGNILAGSKFRGEFEEKVKGVLKDFEKMKEKEGIDPILFIDEVHQIIGAGNGGQKEGVDLSNMIKPGLASGDLSCIGATTEEEYNTKIIKDKALTRRFQTVKIVEPTAKETLRIIEQGIKPVLEKFHNVKYPKAVLEKAVTLSGKYVTTQFFPDKAISVVDSIGARLNTTINGRTIATIEDAEEIVSVITGTPVSAFKEKKGKDAYVDLSAEIGKSLFGQEEAIKKVVEQVELSKAGMADEGQPVGSFLLLGPTGTGKTELAKQIAAKTESNFKKINMSEFSEEHSVAKLFGAPPGYEGHEEGGLLTNEIMNFPHTVLLLDEIEKANRKVYDALLGIIDGATMTDGRDNVVDFKNVLILMTSNAGAAASAMTKAPLGISMDHTSQEKKAKFEVSQDIINNTFAPEFRNKLSGIVHFNSLSKDIMIKIVDKFIKLAEIKLVGKGIKLKVDKKARELMAERGYDPKMGARPIKREVENSITKKLIKPILKGDLKKGHIIKVTVKDKDINIEFTEVKKPVPKVKAVKEPIEAKDVK